MSGTLEHLLIFCPALNQTRSRLLNLVTKVSLEHQAISQILNSALSRADSSGMVQLLLDCTVLPEVILAVQTYGKLIQDRLLYLGRTWCYNIHRDRMTQMELLKFR